MNCKDYKHLIPQNPKDPDVMCCEWMDNKFVCSSSYHIKTHPRWCPLKKYKKELDNIEEQEYEKQFEEEMMRLQPELFEDN